MVYWVIGVAKQDTVPVDVLWAGAAAVVVAALITVGGVLWQTHRTHKHERAERERDELRGVVDEAAEWLSGLRFELIEAITETEAEIASAGGSLDQIEDDQEFVDTTHDRFELTFASLRRADGFSERLALRLGEEDEAVVEYRLAVDILRTIEDRLSSLEFVEREVRQGEFAETSQHAENFRAACHKIVGSNLKD